MSTPNSQNPNAKPLTFISLITAYNRLQSNLVLQVRALASNMSAANPGSFILLQFQMAQVTQMGESISNLVNQVNIIIGKTISNQAGR
ncbi:MAG: hypothetical protein IT584_03145 [Chlamydiae bacterium]|nr:hypothetical protein [Chlamydiota bacterium]